MFKANDVSDSVNKESVASGNTALINRINMQDHGTIANSGKAFDPTELGLQGDDLIDQGEEQDTEAASESGGEVAEYVKDLGGLLKGVSREEAAQIFTEFMKENGDGIYEAASAEDPDHPIAFMAEQMSEALKDTDYTAIEYGGSFEIALETKAGDLVAQIPVGPTINDFLTPNN